MNALQADPRRPRGRGCMQARVDLALGDGVAAEAGDRRAPARPASPVDETAPSARPCPAAPGRSATARSTRPAGAAGAHAAYARPHPRPRLAGARRRRRRRRRVRSRARAGAAATATSGPTSPASAAPPATSPARSRRPTGRSPLGPRNVEALVLRGELTRGQYGLAAALPWFDRALEVDPDNVAALLERAITYGDLGRMGDMLADAREAAPPDRRPSDRLIISRRCSPRAPATSSSRVASTTAPAAPSTTGPPGMLLASAIDFETGNVEQAARRLAAAGRDAARQPQGAPAARRGAVADGRSGRRRRDAAPDRRPARRRHLQPDPDRPRAGAAAAMPPRASLYLARAAAPRPGALDRARPARATASSPRCAAQPRPSPATGRPRCG